MQIRPPCAQGAQNLAGALALTHGSPSDRHLLDKPDIDRQRFRQRGEHHPVSPCLLHQHRIDLCPQTGLNTPVQQALPVRHRSVRPRDRTPSRLLHGVDADVDRVQSRPTQRRQTVRQQNTVRRHRNSPNPRDCLQHRNQLRAVPAHQRLSSRDSDLCDTEGSRRLCCPNNFLIGQDVRVAQMLRMRRHTVKTPQIAPVGNRDAQIADLSSKSVNHSSGSSSFSK